MIKENSTRQNSVISGLSNNESSMENIDNNINNLENLELNNNIDLATLITTMGFSRFREFGMTREEIHLMRVVFHSNYLINNRNAPRSDWEPVNVINREEQWINQVNQEENNDQNRLRQRVIEYTLNNNISEIISMARQSIRSRITEIMNQENQEESNSKFFLGFILGLFLNYFVIIIVSKYFYRFSLQE